MTHWSSSTHPISDLRDWNDYKRLEINPRYQRQEVWTEVAKVMLMDSILKNIPMPKIFLEAVIRNGNTYRIVIDGQQRIKAILSFLNGEFNLSNLVQEEFRGKYFEELPDRTKADFLSYKIDVNEIRGAEDEIIREIYSRVNKYTVALNKQELRRADFPGDFLDLSEEITLNDYFSDAKIFSIANRRRLNDVEYISELLAVLISGIQDKKNTLDEFYQEYTIWNSEERNIIKSRFKCILDDLQLLFPSNTISKTRFKQKSDFYSLFAAINELHIEGFTIKEKNLDMLQQDLEILNNNIEPESEISLFQEYAIKCVSQANTFTSRSWRKDLLKNVLSGTYTNEIPPASTLLEFHKILEQLSTSGFCPSEEVCAFCQNEIIHFDLDNVILTWNEEETNFQLSNAFFMHHHCYNNFLSALKDEENG